MNRKFCLLAIAVTVLVGCSTTHKYQYVWYKDGGTATEVRQASSDCGNRIGENTVSTTERKKTFHACMQEKGYRMKKLEKTL